MSSRAACLAALLGASGALKHITLVRHGQTHANVWMRQPGNAWGAPGFVDPDLVDTRLTPEGEAQAAALNARLLADGARFDAVLCSPYVVRFDDDPPEASNTSLPPHCLLRIAPDGPEMRRVAFEHHTSEAPVSYTHLTLPTKRIV